MAGHNIPHFQNDGGHRVIEIGVKEFMCTGASVPYDHPHIFIDLGDESEKVCSYCSTLYRYNPSLKADQTNPAGCFDRHFLVSDRTLWRQAALKWKTQPAGLV